MAAAILIPGILTRDPEEIYEKLKYLEAIPEITEAHIDFADNVLVPNATALPSSLWPYKTRLKLEAHLMVAKPQHYFHALEHIGVKRIILHHESFSKDADLESALGNLKAMGFECAVAINPETDISVFNPVASMLDAVVLMSIHPGFQGQPFLPGTLARIKELHKSHPSLAIQVDGGVGLKNIETLVAHGITRLTVGSWIWHSKDPKKRIFELMDVLK